MVDQPNRPQASPLRSAWLPASCSLLLLRILLALVLVYRTQAAPNGSPPASLNISIPLASPNIVYTPFLCNATQVIASPQICAGGWQAAATPPSSPSNPVFVSVSLPGPITDSSNLIPQLFFRFQASALYLQTIAPSNATATITIDANGTFLSTQFDSALGGAAILNIPANVSSLFTITVNPQTAPTVLVLQGIIVTAAADIPLSSLFPSATLPPSASLPTLTSPSAQPTSSSSSSSALPSQTGVVGSNTKKKIAEAVGITIGLGLGLTALAVLGFLFWRKRRRGGAEGGGGGRANAEKERKRSRRKSRNGVAGRASRGRPAGPELGAGAGMGAEGSPQQSEWRTDTDTPARHRPRWPV